MVIAKGLDGIVVDKTALSRVDGQKGELVYRGYLIDEMAKCSFEEVCHLFLYAKLPTSHELAGLDARLKSNRVVPAAVLEFLENAPREEAPMALLRTATSMLSGYLKNIEDTCQEALLENSIALI